MDLEKLNSVYFLGIGGIGMSALARYFHDLGITVSGYDKVKTPLTEELSHLGITITYIDEESTLNKQADLVILTPAIPKDNKQFNFYSTNNYKIFKTSSSIR